MLKLNAEKEGELVSKYGLVQDMTTSSYKYLKSFRIYASTHPKWAYEIHFNSLSRKAQDKIYQLIKNDVLYVETESNVKKEKLKNKIRQLEQKLKKMEED